MGEYRSADSPMEPNANQILTPTREEYEADPSDVTKYKSIFSETSFLAMYKRPDISFAICNLSSFQMNPDYSHRQAFKPVLHYLAGNKIR